MAVRTVKRSLKGLSKRMMPQGKAELLLKKIEHKYFYSGVDIFNPFQNHFFYVDLPCPLNWF